MFRLDRDRNLILFTLDERDLALALVRLEGYRVVDNNGHEAAFALAPVFGLEKRPRELRASGWVEPAQDSPGVWSYRVSKLRGKVAA